jgi:hypothetical protein
VRNALLSKSCGGHARDPGSDGSSVGPVLPEPTQNFSQVARLFLTPCHFGFSPVLMSRRFCRRAAEEAANGYGKEIVTQSDG